MITAFAVFNVEQTSHAMEVDDEEILQHLKKICHTFDLCEDEMQAQLFDGMGRVQAIARQMEVENIRAWQIYLENLSKSRAVIPSATLALALLFWVLCGVGTSGVESGFGVSRMKWSNARHHAYSEAEEWIHHILHFNPEDHDRSNLFQTARLCYASLYGPPRLPPASRIDVGSKQKLSNVRET